MVLKVGDTLPVSELQTLDGQTINVSHPDQPLHIQFRRFAGCPICHLHLRSFVNRNGDLTAANIMEIVFFHSTAEELREYESGLPFAVIPDPEKRVYKQFGVEASLLGNLHPLGLIRFPLVMYRFIVDLVQGNRKVPPTGATGGRLGLPADFFVGTDGKLLAVKYGSHPSDNWSVDEVLAMKAQQ